ncbi:hypothetical protein EVAR_9069_1 [Eumeta japonica]|uniref:Uncharacterized protein n=1 Tax=Eumeta variegata TaxID=151549 RepID=A0A4C1TW38_EUMVA|nr:hypothetical protein EVAR_9069_1 [Eumeta japonica]
MPCQKRKKGSRIRRRFLGRAPTRWTADLDKIAEATGRQDRVHLKRLTNIDIEQFECEPLKRRRSQPLMDTHQPGGVSNALPAFRKGGHLMGGEVGPRNF